MTDFMNILGQTPLFGDRGETLRELGGRFRGERAKVDAGEIVMLVLAALAVGAVFWLLARWAARREGRGAFHNPKQLFRKLADAHRLRFGQRQLLLKAARFAKAPLPATLFLRPDLFDIASAHSQLASRADELAAIKRRLFGPSHEAKFYAPASTKRQDAERQFHEWKAETDARITAIRAQRNGEGHH